MKVRIPFPVASDGGDHRAGNRAAHIDGKTLRAGARQIHVTPKGDPAQGKIFVQLDASLEITLACYYYGKSC